MDSDRPPSRSVKTMNSSGYGKNLAFGLARGFSQQTAAESRFDDGTPAAVGRVCVALGSPAPARPIPVQRLINAEAAAATASRAPRASGSAAVSMGISARHAHCFSRDLGTARHVPDLSFNGAPSQPRHGLFISLERKPSPRIGGGNPFAGIVRQPSRRDSQCVPH